MNTAVSQGCRLSNKCTNPTLCMSVIKLFTALETRFVLMSVMMPVQRPHEKVLQWRCKFILKKLNKKCIRVNSVQYCFSCSKMEPCEVLTDSCQVSEGNTQLPWFLEEEGRTLNISEMLKVLSCRIVVFFLFPNLKYAGDFNTHFH